MIAKTLFAAAAIAGPFGNKNHSDHECPEEHDSYEEHDCHEGQGCREHFESTVTVKITDDGEMLVLSREDLDGYTTNLDELPRIVVITPDGEEQLVFSPEMFNGAFRDNLLQRSSEAPDPESLLIHSRGWPESAAVELYGRTAEEQSERAARETAEHLMLQAERIAREAESLARVAERQAMDAERQAHEMKRERAALSEEQIALQEELMVMSHKWMVAEDKLAKAAVRVEIEAAAAEMFDLRLEAHEAQLEQMRERLEGLEAELEAQREGRDEMIDAWLEERLEE